MGRRSAKLQAARRNRRIYEVLTDDKDDFKVVADARLKMEKDTALVLPCIEKNDSRGEPRAIVTSVDATVNSQAQKIKGRAEK